ncbi:hypothetical protein O0I10_007669 [Lichtheimia ornata]|uniref:Uncharacterized protein n=1 Tax=Lichtheimia ornata TaxID=688661 RepID=A0AAD7UZX9_9FUNG|nr:uncharacterized protein O0I10_007669 [Lichtheimia ornata]KAJ8656592.1 hypothetical protein O0I10_007669 [Lichtheimia ornata]
MDAEGEPMEVDGEQAEDGQQAEQAAIDENRNRIDAFRANANRRNVRTVTRNCKLRTVLNDDYRELRHPLRTLAEDYTVVRRDTFDLVNMDVLRWIQEGAEGTPCPDILNQGYWRKAFTLCTLPPTHTEEATEPHFLHLIQTFNWCFQRSRLLHPDDFAEDDPDRPDIPQPLYEPPDFNSPTLRSRLADLFARGEAIPAIKNHLALNPPKYMKHTFTAYFYDLQNRIEPNLPRQPQAFANVMVRHLLNHDEPADVDFDDLPVALRADFRVYYQNHFEEFERCFAGYNLTEVGKSPGRRVNAAYIPGALRYLTGILFQEAERLDSQRWTVLPIGKLQISFVPIDIRVLYWVCRLAHGNAYGNENIVFEAPPAIRRDTPGPGGVMFIPQNIIAGNTNPLLKEQFFEQLFNLDPLSKRRMRYSPEYVFNPDVEPITFKFSLNTDGVRVCFHFVRALVSLQGERMPDTSADVRYYARELNLTNWHRGMYHLNKEPGGLDAERLQGTRIVGIDPGIRAIITGTDTTQHLEVRQTRQQHVVQISNKEYQHRSLSNWIRQKTLHSRIHSPDDMATQYLALSAFPARTCDLQNFLDHVHLRSFLHNTLHNFACHYRHREQRCTTFSARVSAQESIVNQILNMEDPEDLRDLPFNHRDMGKRQRKLTRRAARAQRQLVQDTTMKEPEADVETIVAYGAARFGATSKRHQAVPVETLRARIARRALLILVDEFRTSVTCHVCNGRLQQFRERQTLVCQHNKKYIRDFRNAPVYDDEGHYIEGTWTRGKPRQWCMDENGARLHWTSICPGREQVHDFRNKVYALKWCPNCQFVFDRDINASTNIHRIFELYMANDGGIESRPAAMSRGQVQEVVNEVEEEDELETDDDDEELL